MFCPLAKIDISLSEKQERAPQEHGHKKQSSIKWLCMKNSPGKSGEEEPLRKGLIFERLNLWVVIHIFVFLFQGESQVYPCACRIGGCHWQTCRLMLLPMWCLPSLRELRLLGVCPVVFLLKILKMSTEFLWMGPDLTDIYRSIFNFLAHLRWLCVQMKLWDLVMVQRMKDLRRNNLNLKSWWAELGSSTSQVICR